MRALTGMLALCGALVGSTVSAQTVRNDFEKLPVNEPIVYVVPEDGGAEARGRLIAFDPESIALLIDGRRIEFQRDDVRRICRHGDSYKDGGRLGAIIGAIAAAGLVIGADIAACGSSVERPPESCKAAYRILTLMFVAPLGGTIGFAFGSIIDYHHTGRTLIYERPRSRSSSFVGAIAPAKHGVALSIRW